MVERRSRVALLAVAGVVVVAAVLLTNVLPFRSIIAEHRRVEQAKEQLAVIQAENQRLEEQAEFLKTDAGVEMIARRDFGLVREGEVAYVVTDPTDEPFTPDPKQPEVAPEPWWKGIWDFLTGRDLTG